MTDPEYLTAGDLVTLSEKGLDHFEYWKDPKPRQGYVAGCWNYRKHIHIQLEGVPHMLGYRRDFWVLA